MRDFKARSIAAIGIVLTLVVLQYIYVFDTAEQYAYYGLITTPRSLVSVVLFTVIAVLPVLWLPMHVQRPSSLVHWILYVVVIGPAIVLSLHGSELTIEEMGLMSAALIVSFGLMCGFSRLPLLILKRPKISPLVFWIGFSLSTLALLGYVISTFGFQIRLVALSEVYDLRSSYKNTLATQGALVAYAVGWLSNAMGPFAIATGIHRRNLLFIGAGVLLQILVFSTGGHKTILLSGLFLLCIYVALKGNGEKFVKRFVWGTAGFIIVAYLFDITIGSQSLTSLITRRVFMFPGILTGMYVDFFASNPQTLLSQSVFGGLSEYPYSMSIPNVIGAHFFGRPGMSANANVWADAYANFGYGGIFFFAVLLSVVLWLADSLARTKSWKVACLVVALPAFALSNSALLTVMLTHGFAVALLLLYLMPPMLSGTDYNLAPFFRLKRQPRIRLYSSRGEHSVPLTTSAQFTVGKSTKS